MKNIYKYLGLSLGILTMACNDDLTFPEKVDRTVDPVIEKTMKEVQSILSWNVNRGATVAAHVSSSVNYKDSGADKKLPTTISVGNTEAKFDYNKESTDITGLTYSKVDGSATNVKVTFTKTGGSITKFSSSLTSLEFSTKFDANQCLTQKLNGAGDAITDSLVYLANNEKCKASELYITKANDGSYESTRKVTYDKEGADAKSITKETLDRSSTFLTTYKYNSDGKVVSIESAEETTIVSYSNDGKTTKSETKSFNSNKEIVRTRVVTYDTAGRPSKSERFSGLKDGKIQKGTVQTISTITYAYNTDKQEVVGTENTVTRTYISETEYTVE